MIRNHWYAILESKEVKKRNQLLGVKRLGEKLAVWRDSNDQVHCIYDVCAHRGASLSCGVIVDDELQCPFHGLQYAGDGKVTIIPSRGKDTPVPNNFKVHAYPVREAHGFIWIWWGEPKENEDYPDLPWWDELDDKFISSTLQDPWDTHYSRCIENQLDVTHLFLVHRTTIGRGMKSVSDGPVVQIDDGEESFRIHVENRKDDGTPSKLPKEMTIPDRPPNLFFKFPHCWQNNIAPDMRVAIAFVPIDEDHTLLYLRYYQRMVRTPVLGKVFARIGRFFSKIIAHQDRRVVNTQLPKRSELKMGENLFPADYPIMVYRRIRDQKLKEQNQE